MDTILTTTTNFDFSKLSLTSPTGIQGGSYFTRILNDGSPLYMQCPTCKTKQGIVNSGRKMYSDLILTKEDNQFVNWIEQLEDRCQQLILDKSSDWFENPLDLNDIESSFISLLKSYKSGSLYILKCGVDQSKQGNNKAACVIYNESEQPISMQEVTSDISIIPLIHINGVKFSSKNFQIEIILRQIMVLNTIETTPSILIKRSSPIEETCLPIEPVKVDNVEETIIIDTTDENNNDVKIESELDSQELDSQELDSQELDSQELDSQESEQQNMHQEEELVNTLGKEEFEKKNSLEEKTENIENPDEKDENPDEKDESESDEESEVDSDLEEVDINVTESEPFHLKDKTDVYYQIYKVTRDKLKDKQKNELLNFFKHKQIDTKMLLDDLYDSEEDYLEDSDELDSDESNTL